MWTTLAAMAVFTLIVFLFVEFSRRFLILGTVLLAAMALSIPVFASHLNDWFRWAKLLSVLLPALLLGLGRLAVRYPRPLTAFLQKKRLMWTAYGVLLLNIAEAVAKDLSLGHFFNAGTGLLLMLTIPVRPENWQIETGNKQDLLFPLPVLWTVLYTLWNVVFVFGETPAYTLQVLCILLVPLLYATLGRRSDLWYTARVYSLALSLYIRFAWDFVTPWMDIGAWATSERVQIGGLVTLVLGAAYGTYRWLAHKPVPGPR